MPKNLITLVFGYFYDQEIGPNVLPITLLVLTFGHKFNQKIGSNVFPKNLTTLVFGYDFNQKIDPNILPHKLTTLTFGTRFNQKLECLPANLKYLSFGFDFNKDLSGDILPNNLIIVNFNWHYGYQFFINEMAIQMLNSIPRHFNVVLFATYKFFNDDNGPKWPIHVVNYGKLSWSPDIYQVINQYTHQIHGDITVLINKNSYQPDNNYQNIA